MHRLPPLLLAGLLAIAACGEPPAADPRSEQEADSSLARATPCPGAADVDSTTVEEFVYFVGVGHSNMRGRSADDAGWQGEFPPIPGVTRQWAWSGPEAARFADLDDYFGAWYGPEPDQKRQTLWPAFAHRFAECTGKGIVVTMTARGGSALLASAVREAGAMADNNWDPDYEGTPDPGRFAEAVAVTEDFAAAMVEAYGEDRVRFGGWIVLLGGNDAPYLVHGSDSVTEHADPTRLGEFERTWDRFLAAFETTVRPHVPQGGSRPLGGRVYVIQEGDLGWRGRYPSAGVPPASVVIAELRAVMERVCEEAHGPSCEVATKVTADLRHPRYYNPDHIHFRQNALTLIGRTAADGVAPDFTAP